MAVDRTAAQQVQCAGRDPRAEAVAHQYRGDIGANAIKHLTDAERLDVRAVVLDLSIVLQTAWYVIAGPTPDDETHASAAIARNGVEDVAALLDGVIAGYVVAMNPEGRNHLGIIGREELFECSSAPALAALHLLHLQGRVVQAGPASVDAALLINQSWSRQLVEDGEDVSAAGDTATVGGGNNRSASSLGELSSTELGGFVGTETNSAAMARAAGAATMVSATSTVHP